jgi:hypothetical protein
MIHSVLAVTLEGFPFGVLGMKTCVRPPDELSKGQSRKQRTISDKESVKCPGPTVMWRGFLTLHEITEIDRIFRQNEQSYLVGKAQARAVASR